VHAVVCSAFCTNRLTTCLENLETSGNLRAVREPTRSLGNIGGVSLGGKYLLGKLSVDSLKFGAMDCGGQCVARLKDFAAY